jgi:hypothetical protein
MTHERERRKGGRELGKERKKMVDCLRNCNVHVNAVSSYTVTNLKNLQERAMLRYLLANFFHETEFTTSYSHYLIL